MRRRAFLRLCVAATFAAATGFPQGLRPRILAMDSRFAFVAGRGGGKSEAAMLDLTMRLFEGGRADASLLLRGRRNRE